MTSNLEVSDKNRRDVERSGEGEDRRRKRGTMSELWRVRLRIWERSLKCQRH